MVRSSFPPLERTNHSTTTQRSTIRHSRTKPSSRRPTAQYTTAQYTTVFGDYYSIDGVVRVLLPFNAILNDKGRPPQVNVATAFTAREPLSKVIHAIVCVEGVRFLIYGYTNPHPLSATNNLLKTLKPSTLWHGEIVVFVLGKRVPVLSRPQSVERRKHILAIRL